MVSERVKSRAACRAVYLASPLRFQTVLHPFAWRHAPLFHIDSWKKDPSAWEKHKLWTAKERKRGRWFYGQGPLSGVQVEGWPEPALLGASALVQVAARAQEEKLQDRVFWEQVAERALQLRDVIPVGDVAALLDALVSANLRHKQLMKTMAREIVDDVDKMPLDEVAVVANAYAHFRCLSEPMLEALAGQATAILNGAAPPYVANAGSADIGSLTVLLKSLVTLRHKSDVLLSAASEALVRDVDRLSLQMISEQLSAFVTFGHRFEADASFWAVVTSKVPGGRMAVLCPLLRAIARLGAQEPALREALVAEVSRGLRDAPALPSSRPFVDALGHGGGRFEGADLSTPRFPPFAAPTFAAAAVKMLWPAPADLIAPPATDSAASFGGLGVAPEILGLSGGTGAFQTEEAGDAVEGAGAARPRGIGWYNIVARCPSLPPMPVFAGFDPAETSSRNRTGVRVAEALEGLNEYWRGACAASNTAPPLAAEADLVLASVPLLRSALQGLAPGQLVACAEVYAASRPEGVSMEEADVFREAMRDIVQEAVRKLSNFAPAELKRLRAASLRVGLEDPYLERARRRRFPKALRKELRDGDA